MRKTNWFFPALIITLVAMVIAGCQPKPKTEAELRKDYPLYDLDFMATGSDTGTIADALVGAEAGAIVTVKETPEKLVLSNVNAVNDPAFIKKYPDSSGAYLYAVKLHVDEVVLGTVEDTDKTIYVPRFYIENGVFPDAGESFYCSFAEDASMSAMIDKADKLDKSQIGKPHTIGLCLFYETKDGHMLSIFKRNGNEDFDMLTKDQFVDKIRVLRK